MSERSFIAHGPQSFRLLLGVDALVGAWVVERWEPLVTLMMILLVISLFPTESQRDE